MTFLIDYCLPFIVILSILVFFHELGHFLVARRSGVRVDVFSIGFGPELIGWTDRHKTRWSFSMIPLGGYVKMCGDANAASAGTSESISSLSEEEKNMTLASKHPKTRILVALAGPLANYILAIVILTGLAIVKGIPFYTSEVGTVQKDMPAEQAGIQKGDVILRIGAHEIKRFDDIPPVLKNYGGQDTRVQIKRNEQILEKKVSFYQTNDQGVRESLPKLGVSPSSPSYTPLSPVYAVLTAVDLCWNLSAQTFKGIIKMFERKSGDELGGLLSIGDMASKSTKDGLGSVLWFLAVLSVNLGFINLLPIPVLDGGHILLNAIEWVRGKALSQKLQERIFTVGFVLILGLMLYSNVNDLKRYQVFQWILNLFG